MSDHQSLARAGDHLNFSFYCCGRCPLTFNPTKHPTPTSLSLSLSEARSSIEKQKKSECELQSNPGGRDDESHDGDERWPKVDQTREDLRPGWEDPGSLPVSPIGGGVWAQSPCSDPKEHKAYQVCQVAEDPVHVFPLHSQRLHGLLVPLDASKE